MATLEALKSLKMKTLLILSIIAMVAVGATAQVNMFPQVGLNFTQFDADPDSLDSQQRLGYNFGIDFRIGEKGIFQPGCHFYRIQTDLKSKEELQQEDSFADEVTIDIFKIPANLGLFFVNEEDLLIWATGGVGFWIPVSMSSAEGTFEVNDLRPFFMTGNASLHFQFWKVALSFQYDQGFSQVHNRISNSTSKTMGVSFGYVL